MSASLVWNQGELLEGWRSWATTWPTPGRTVTLMLAPKWQLSEPANPALSSSLAGKSRVSALRSYGYEFKSKDKMCEGIGRTQME